MSKILVFAGPTLASAEGSRALALPRGLELRPPAQRGDVLNALCDEPDVLVLLDGYYYSVPAVTHKEILYALESGVRVIGASSMGALRAAELLPYGMEGVGRIFELFRDGVLDGDDEVALLHASEEFGYRPLTVALVDLREAASQLVADGEATQEAAAALIAEVKAWPFKERFSRRIERRAVEELGAAAARRLTALLAGGGLKARDAEQAMALASSPPSSPRSAPPPGTATTFLGYFHEWHLKVPGGEDEDAPSFLEAWNMLRIFHPEAEAFVTRLRHRFLLATACRQRGEEPPADRVDEIAEVLRQSTIGGFRRPLLPRRELRLEAEDQALAESALLAPGGAPEVLSELAVGLGLPARGGLEKIEELLGIQDDLLPAWSLARAAACTSAFPAAVALAGAAKEVVRAFRAWSGGARITEASLLAVAAEVWECSPSEVVRRAAARGLHSSQGFSPGFRGAFELIAAAQRLPVPVNDYPTLRERLRSAALSYPLELPVVGTRTVAR